VYNINEVKINNYTSRIFLGNNKKIFFDKNKKNIKKKKQKNV